MKRTVLAGLVLVLAVPPAARAQPVAYVGAGSFALPGPGSPGAIEKPAAIALSPDGIVHIAGPGRVAVFSGPGSFQREYGTGTLEEPRALAIDSGGRSYVLDGKARRVFIYSAAGEKIGEFGDEGDRLGEFSDPRQVSLGPGGVLAVLDVGRRVVLFFSPDGFFLREIGLPENLVREPSCLAVTPDGAVWLGDGKAPGRLYRLPGFEQAPAGSVLPDNLVREVSVVDRLSGQAPASEFIAAAAHESGAIFLLESETGRLWRCPPGGSGAGPGELYGGRGTGPGSFRRAAGLAGAGDELVILDTDLRKVERIRVGTETGLPGGAPPLQVRISAGHPSRIEGALLALYTDSVGPSRFFFRRKEGGVIARAAEPVRFTTVYGDSASGLRPAEEASAVLYTQGLSSVCTVAAADSLVVVSDPSSRRFATFRMADGELRGTVGDRYEDERKFGKPGMAAFLPDGRVAVTDPGNERVCVVPVDGINPRSVRTPTPKPFGIAVSPGGTLFVWSQDGTGGVRLDLETAKAQSLGPEFPLRIGGMAFDRAGNTFVLDRASGRIHLIGPDGRPLLPPFGPPEAFKEVSGIFTDDRGNVYIADAGAGATSVIHWSLHAGPPGACAIRYTASASELAWTAAPGTGIRGYRVLGRRGGKEWPIEQTTGLSARIPAAGARTPESVRVVSLSASGLPGEGNADAPLPGLAALAAFEAGKEEPAAALARSAFSQIRGGGSVQADSGAIAAWRLILFFDAERRRDFGGAVALGDSLRATVAERHRVRFRRAMIRSRSESGQHAAAARELLDFARDFRSASVLGDTAVTRSAFRIYRAGLGSAGDTTLAAAFLEGYARLLPDSLAGLRSACADTLQALELRKRFWPALALLRDRNFEGAVRALDHLPGGPIDSMETPMRAFRYEVEAAALYALGKKERAAKQFAQAAALRPGLSMPLERSRFRRLFGFDLCDSTAAAWMSMIPPAPLPAAPAPLAPSPGTAAPGAPSPAGTPASGDSVGKKPGGS